MARGLHFSNAASHADQARTFAPLGPGCCSLAGVAQRMNAIVPVSVVVPCYRCRATIERAVASVVAQTWRPAQLILVDDASDDDTAVLLDAIQQRLGDWVEVLALAENGGAAQARNAGWERATQTFVASAQVGGAIWLYGRPPPDRAKWAQAPRVVITCIGVAELDLACVLGCATRDLACPVASPSVCHPVGHVAARPADAICAELALHGRLPLVVGRRRRTL